MISFDRLTVDTNKIKINLSRNTEYSSNKDFELYSDAMNWCCDRFGYESFYNPPEYRWAYRGNGQFLFSQKEDAVLLH